MDSFRPRTAMSSVALLACAVLLLIMLSGRGAAQPTSTEMRTCRIESIVFEGWQARQLSNACMSLSRAIGVTGAEVGAGPK
jgi:hypothetical protein